MVMCWAPDCKHYNQRETCKFFRFPKSEKERRKWKKLIRRNEEPGSGAFICSCHFKDGKRENGPELFLHNEEKIFKEHHLTPEKKRARKLKPATEVSVEEDIPEASASCSQRSGSGLEVSSEQDLTETIAVAEFQPLSVDTSLPSTSQDPLTLCTSSSSVLSPSMVDVQSYFLRKENEELKRSIQDLPVKFTFENIANNTKLVLLYTGLPSPKIFQSLLILLENMDLNYILKWKVDRMTKADQLLMTLMKLRQNFPHEDLAYRFNCGQATVSNIVLTFIDAIHSVLYVRLMSNIPSRQKNERCLPSCFSTFTNCRIILDCTEVFSAVPRKSMKAQRLTYSSYKHRNTWKGLVGVAPNGTITFISTLYPGSTSDKKIVQHCGILNQLEAGDLILADKGFLIRDILPPGVELNLPPFLVTPQFTREQVYQTESIARARVHVERAIRRMKCYSILDFIPHTLLPYAGIVFQTVGALTNLQYPLIKEVQQYYTE